jgi:manganese/zinc/iron transport system permease protein
MNAATGMWGELSAMHAWAIATAAVVAAGCALVGTLLVVRRMSLLGDAISHAILPGIAVAVLAGGRPGGLLVLVGAVAAALVTVLLVQVLRREGGLADDAGTGVVFTTLFALGVVIVTAAASRIDLDPGCILYGILELVPFDTVRIAGLEMPRAFLTGATVLVIVAGGLAATWKEQLFTAFDSDAARAVGLRPPRSSPWRASRPWERFSSWRCSWCRRRPPSSSRGGSTRWPAWRCSSASWRPSSGISRRGG